ncbi:Uromodulin [Labeo rohita]|uniref:Uromodulin n=1 Tax=Labeo rohita TaxID=84645 RepID=A0ABQ8L7I3_LABRO|nr:Uromodulin [Labeo rohita]
MASFQTAYTSADPCYNYKVLDNPWRSTNYGSGSNCDWSVSWSGWYRLFINNVSAQIPDTCVANGRCGTDITLWIRDGHPTVQDGVVTRDFCGHAGSYCCYYGSYPIKVKAFVRSINTSSTAVTPATISTVYSSVDPCYNYTVLDNPWRSTNYGSGSKCDVSVTWSGWYRHFINNVSAQIPDTCVANGRCGTNYPLWIRGGHPTVQDGVVTRDVCAHGGSYCCGIGSFPIKVKACSGNYYVYELVTPTQCTSAYCAVVTDISSTVTTVAPETTTAVILNGVVSGGLRLCSANSRLL